MEATRDVQNPVTGIAHLLIQVSDLDTAEAFYCQLLGLRVARRTHLRNGIPLINTVEGIGLCPVQSTPPTAHENRWVNVEHVALWVIDLETIVTRLRQTGLEVNEPVRNEYGLSLSVYDPDGNRIELIQKS